MSEQVTSMALGAFLVDYTVDWIRLIHVYNVSF